MSPIIKLRQQATLATWPEKEVRSLADFTTEWGDRAGHVLRRYVTLWAGRLRAAMRPACAPTTIPFDVLARVGAHVVAAFVHHYDS